MSEKKMGEGELLGYLKNSDLPTRAYNQIKEIVKSCANIERENQIMGEILQDKRYKQKQTVTREQIDSLMVDIWHTDRCGDSTFEESELIQWLRELGITVED